jgi:hypothetical protein
LGSESKNFISCPHIWTLPVDTEIEKAKAGDLFLVHDHANISASSAGIGPNIDSYGPRFYDISQMYQEDFRKVISKSLESLEFKHFSGDLLWVNNSAIPSVSHTNMAKTLSNQRVTFKGIIKNGVSELMAVHHRQS